MELLDYDNMMAARKEAKQALYVAVGGIVLTLITTFFK
jgi:hypothetical protein